MPQSPIIITLQTKIAEVERYIADMERRVANARRDLGHLQATVHLLNQGSLDPAPAYMGLRRIFRRGEITDFALAALRASPDGLDTNELAYAVMRAKGIAVEEEPFRQAIRASLVTMFRRMAMKGEVRCVGSRGPKGVRVWRV